MGHSNVLDAASEQPVRQRPWRVIAAGVVFVAASCHLACSAMDYWAPMDKPTRLEEVCPQTAAIYPSKHKDLAAAIDQLYDPDARLAYWAEFLGGAVRVP